MNQAQLFKYFFFGVLLLLVVQLLKIFSPFLTPLACAAVLTLLCYPIYAWLLTRVGNRAGLAAGLATTVSVCIIVVPLSLASWLLIHEVRIIYPSIQHWLHPNLDGSNSVADQLPPALQHVWERLSHLASAWGIDATDTVLKTVDDFRNGITGIGSWFVKNVLRFFVGCLVTIISVFFFFRDGARWMTLLFSMIPMDEDHKDHLRERVRTTVTAVVRGVTLTAGAQGILATVGFLLAGVGFPVLLGFAAAFLALLPIGGAAAIWVPVAVVKLAQGAVGSALFVAAWGIIVVGLGDQYLRILFIGSEAKLPTLLLFFGILGGMQIYGFLGILFGPLLITCALAFMTIYNEEYGSYKMRSNPSPSPVRPEDSEGSPT